MNLKRLSVLLVLTACGTPQTTQQPQQKEQTPWHNESRSVRYTPDGHDFVITNGTRRFNRALYGGNSDFRVETGDLPEFTMYLPGMGGNFGFGIISHEGEKWLVDAENIEMRYRDGKTLYKISDPLLGDGHINLEVLALYDTEGIIIKAEAENTPENTQLVWRYGGVSGKKFSRDGDIGADPESVFYLTPDKCESNEIFIHDDNSLDIYYGKGRVLSENERYENHYQATAEEKKKNSFTAKKNLHGVMPKEATLKLTSAHAISSPQKAFETSADSVPVILGSLDLGKNTPYYFAVNKPDSLKLAYKELPQAFATADAQRKAIADRIEINTPDPYINNFGGVLALAADAVWEHPSYQHGAIAWRMPLPGWRGAYIADWMGWHDRAKIHFSAYKESQYTGPATGPSVPNPKVNLARETEERGTALFTSGYIARRPGEQSHPHHYDMNQVFVDQLLRHFLWTGDTAYMREMWPLVERHFAWEKRNFDPDNDGLYNAYASIWASDALEYNGGGVAHSSAYNYYANKMAAQLAPYIGKDASPYLAEAQKIKQAVEAQLWINEKGQFAEFKDNLGKGKVHPQAGLWSFYHLQDSEVPDAFQAWQMLHYVDKEIPHIPLVADGMPEGEYHLLSTTNWMPYTWSVNNVAMAEVQHAALAYWQAGYDKEAYTLWKSTIMESMYLGACPGNFQQLSYYDAMRGELYRDFADAVGMGARTLVEGLFGIQPNLLENKLKIEPGFPAEWEHASLKTPDFNIAYQQDGDTETFTLSTTIAERPELSLVLNARKDDVAEVLVNGKKASWELITDPVGFPQIKINTPLKGEVEIVVKWSGKTFSESIVNYTVATGDHFKPDFGKADILDIKDPQNAIEPANEGDVTVANNTGRKTIFYHLKQGEMSWWKPVFLEVKKPVELTPYTKQNENSINFKISNTSAEAVKGTYRLRNSNNEVAFSLTSGASDSISLTSSELQSGINQLIVSYNDQLDTVSITNWNIKSNNAQTADISAGFNDKVTAIFRNEYVSPRSPYPTVQIPIHGLGDWCSYKAYMDIDDSGLRKKAGASNQITTPQGIPFSTPGDSTHNNIAFVSLWDNYPNELSVDLKGKSSHAYLLMAGSTNPMQSRFTNGVITVTYTDGSTEKLPLRNPENWWPIEQDFYIDNYAFKTGVPKPPRVHLKTGFTGTEFNDYTSIKGFTNYAVDGGAATVIDMPLNPEKELKSLKLEAIANDVVLGLMAVTLQQSNK